MNKYDKRIKNIKKHLETNPHDYEAVWLLLELRSKSYDYEALKRYHKEREEISKWKKEGQLNE